MESVLVEKMSCPWMDNRTAKDYQVSCSAMGVYKQRYPGHEVKQYNIVIDVLGGWSEDFQAKMKELGGE